MSFKAFLVFKDEEPKSNNLAFATAAEAQAYGSALLARWTTPVGVDVRESEEAVNYVWDGRYATQLTVHPTWRMVNGNIAPLDLTGELGPMLNIFDPRPAIEQLNESYQHGGGFRPQSGFTLTDNGDLLYEGDPAYPEQARAQLRLESIRLYPYSYVAIVQLDGSFVVSRMD